jgi:adhesin/invasin
MPRTAALFLVFLSACAADSASSPDVGPPALLEIVSGDAQQGTVDAELSAPVVVRVTDNHHHPVKGQIVNFRVTLGGGSVFAGAAITNANGIVRERWTLGTVAADDQQVEARAVDNDTGSPLVFAVFHATALAGPAAQTSSAGGDSAMAVAGTAVTNLPALRVADQFNNPVSGVAVTFVLTAGGGSITGATQMTNVFGVATLGGWTLGSVPGINTVVGVAAGLPALPMTFNAIGAPGPPATIVLVAGNGQVASPGAFVPIRPSVRVTDANGNGVPGVMVTFVVTSGGGTVNGSTQFTAFDGVATVFSWRLGPTLGANTLTASAPGLAGSPVTFIATALAGPGPTPLPARDKP